MNSCHSELLISHGPISAALMKYLSKFGRITGLDTPFHTIGGQKGQRRDFVFVTYADTESAKRAIEATNGSKLAGYTLRSSYAEVKPIRPLDPGSVDAFGRRRAPIPNQSTALSLIKTPSRSLS